MVLTSTYISQEDRAKCDRVVVKFDAFFKLRTNVIYERAKFNRRDQKEGESVEQYISAFGIRDSSLSKRLQMDANLTLDKAKRALPQKETIHKQTISLQAD